MLKKLLIVLVLAVSSACSSTADKLQPYWLQISNDFMLKGVALYERQQYRASSTEFSHALKTYQRFDYVKGLAQSYLNLAKSEVAQNNNIKARSYLKNLKSLIEGNDLSSASLLVQMDIMESSIAINEGNEKQAIDILNKYLGSAGENKMTVSNNIYMALLINRVRAAINENINSNDWLNIYERSANLSKVHKARLLRFKGQIASHLNNVDLVNNYFLSALVLYREQANPRAVLSTLKEWGDALIKNDQMTDAVKRYESAYKVAASALKNDEMRNILVSLAAIYKQLGDDKNHQRVKRILVP